jgi:hypothetical protein
MKSLGNNQERRKVHYTSDMKPDNTHLIDQLIDIIPDYPALRIMHFVDRESLLSDKLAALTDMQDYEYLILSLDDTIADVLSQRHTFHEHIKTKRVTHTQARYHIQAKMYDYVFVEATIPDPGDFLKRVYASMKNAAMIFILSTVDSSDEIETWRRATEEHYFVAFNTFELTDSIRIISAKKMHGWGG